MGWVTGIVVYLMLWFTVLFTVLPWGVRVPDQPEPGHATSAPINPRLLLKVVVTTVLSGVFWVIVYVMIAYGVVSFRGPAG